MANAHDEPASGLAALLERFITSWNVHDADAMAACWVEEGDLLNTRGVLACGRGAVRDLLAEEHRTNLAGTLARMRLVSFRILPGDHAHVDAWMEVDSMKAGERVTRTNMRVSLVAREEVGGWRYVRVRPCIVLEPAPVAAS